MKNYFNTTSCHVIIEKMKRRDMSNQILGIIANYFTERSIRIDKTHNHNISAVLSGLASGPKAVEFVYDGVLTETLPGGAHLKAYADDLVVVVMGLTMDVLENGANDTLAKSSLREKETVILCGKIKDQNPPVSP